MKQNINLYQLQFQPTKVLLPARQILLLTLLPIVIFFIISLFLIQQQTLLKTKMTSQKKQLKDQQAQLASLQTQLASRKPNPLLLAELDSVKQQQSINLLLFQHLTNQSFGNQTGFSDTLTALSTQRIDNVWLTHYSLSNGAAHIALEGRAISSSLIPEYIDNLASSNKFQGKNFSVFKLDQPTDNPYFNFQLRTHVDRGSPMR